MIDREVFANKISEKQAPTEQRSPDKIGGMSSVAAHFCGRRTPFSEEGAALARAEYGRRRSVALQ